MSSRNYAIDLLKGIAIIFITNSHFRPLYQDILPSLATLGVHGNALFFFVSGYLSIESIRKSTNGWNWYKHKIKRILPTVFVWCICASIIFGKAITWKALILADDYWFVQCILIYYAIIYPAVKRNINLNQLFILSLVISSVYFFFQTPRGGVSVFHTHFHYVYNFAIFVFGAIIKDRASAVKCRSLKTDWVLATVSFGLYFILLFFGKGYGGKYYYMQIAGLLPLIGFLYYLFKAVSHIRIPKKNSLKIIHNSVLYLSSLTLEIYIVQFDFITDKFNAVFPLNTIVIFLIICIAAYALRILTSLCLQTLSDNPYNIKQALRLF